MKIRYYIVLSIIFLALTFLVVYGITSENYDIGFGIELPVALWVCAIVGVFFIYSVFFLLINWARFFMIKSTDYRDFDLLIKQIITQDSSITPKIRNQSFSLLSKVLQRYELKPKLNSPQSTHPKVDKMFALLSSVQNGTYEDIKKYPFIEYNTINDKNYALKGNKNALDILKDSTKSLEVRQFALNIICDSQKEKDIQRALELAKECLNKEIVYKIIEVYALEHRLDSSEIGEYCKIAHFKSKDYVTLAKFLQPKLDPDRWIRFFTDLTNIDPKAKKSHLFTLLELEMIDRVIDELKGSEEEFLAIRAYIDLKKAGKNYSLDIFIPS